MKKDLQTIGGRIILLILFGLSVVILNGCDTNAFEVDTVVDVKFTAISGRLAVEYKLGDLLILDEWKDLNIAQILFLTKDGTSKSVHLHVVAGDFNSRSFTYKIGNIEVVTDPVKWETLMRNVDSFPGVTWKIKDNKTVKVDEPETEENPDKKKEKGLGKKL